MGVSKASAEWTGTLKEGRGTMKPAHAEAATFTAGSRFEGQPQSNPEELIGAALAGCFSMALTLGLEKAGFKPERVRTQRRGEAREGRGRLHASPAIQLTSEAKVPGIEAAQLPGDCRGYQEGLPGLQGPRPGRRSPSPPPSPLAPSRCPLARSDEARYAGDSWPISPTWATASPPSSSPIRTASRSISTPSSARASSSCSSIRRTRPRSAPSRPASSATPMRTSSAAGAVVVGISSDGPESHRSFARRHNLGYRLLTDRGSKVKDAFGMPRFDRGASPSAASPTSSTPRASCAPHRRHAARQEARRRGPRLGPALGPRRAIG